MKNEGKEGAVEGFESWVKEKVFSMPPKSQSLINYLLGMQAEARRKFTSVGAVCIERIFRSEVDKVNGRPNYGINYWGSVYEHFWDSRTPIPSS